MSKMACACTPLSGPCDLHRLGLNNRNPYAGRLQGEVVFCIHGMLVEGPACGRCESDLSSLSPTQAESLHAGEKASTQRGFPVELVSLPNCPQCGSNDRNFYTSPCGTKWYGVSQWHAASAEPCISCCPSCRASVRDQRRMIYREFEQLIPGYFIKQEHIEAVECADIWHLENHIEEIQRTLGDIAGDWADS